MEWREIRAGLQQDQQQLDLQIEQFSRLATDKGSRIYCRDGCGNCCTLAVNCSFPEAVAITARLTAEQKTRITEELPRLQQISRQANNLKQFLSRFRQQSGGCPFLDQQRQRCEIYPYRPYSCRSLLSTRPASWCGIDFATLHPLEKQAFLSSLDPELVAFPTHYLAASQELGAELESQTSSAMRRRFGFGLSGNLIYLVWLELQDQLSGMIAEQPETAREFLARKQLEVPFSLQFSE